MYADNVQKPTAEELEEARHHAEHTHELEAGLDHPASGHEFDDHALRDAEDVPLRQH
jgi:ubiquinol-cytochrome c reductase cytochrome b subunit